MNLLSIIAALVSLPSCETEANFPAQATCDRSQWRALSGLRSSCRALRDAMRLAVSGLRSVTIAPQERNRALDGEEKRMPFETAIALPRIVKLIDAHGPGLSALMPSLLKELTHISFHSRDIYGGEDEPCSDACGAIALNRSNNLESVNINRVSNAAASALLSSLAGAMKELHLSNCARKGALALSREAALTIETAALNASNADGLLLRLLESPSLVSLTLCSCDFAHPRALRQLPGAVNLRHISCSNADCSRVDYALEKTLAAGISC